MSLTGTPPVQPAASPPPVSRITPYTRKMIYGVLALGCVGTAVFFIVTWDRLPGCNSGRARSTLSDIVRAKQSDISRFDNVEMLSRTEEEVQCKARVTLDDKSMLSIDYKLTKQDGEMRLFITEATPVT